MSVQRERFSSRASPELLTTMREIARKEGRPFQAVLEDAMQEYIQNCTRDTPRAAVMATSGTASRETAAFMSCWQGERYDT